MSRRAYLHARCLSAVPGFCTVVPLRPRFFPFSYGPTIYAGKNMALIEMRMVLCWILRFSRAPGVVYEEWEAKTQDWFVVHHEPLFVSVSLRE
jgi:hypothetical protein